MDKERGTVERIVKLIAFLASTEGEVGIKQIAEELDLPRSTTHRLIQQLISLSMMQRVAGTRKYEFGPEMYRLGAMISNKVNIIQLAMPALQRIVQRSHEGCTLGLYREADATLVFAAHVESPNPLRYQLKLDDPVSVLWGSSGHAVLAHLPLEQVKHLMKGKPRSPTGLPPLPISELGKELRLIAEQGYAVSKRGEKIAGASGISAPFFGPGGRIAGCFSLTIPSLRYPEAEQDELGRMLALEARQLSGMLSGKSTA